MKYEGCLIVISHDRHCLNEVCTHCADIDYETVITYTGGYDDMVLATTQIRARVEAQNAQREKRIAQLNEFIARFSAGTRSSQVMSRKKEVEGLQTSALASRTCNARTSGPSAMPAYADYPHPERRIVVELAPPSPHLRKVSGL